VRSILGTLTEYQETIEAHEDRFLPGVLADDE
jgi:UDP-sulfoquinovose synthase